MKLYTVRPGETPASVARRFGVETGELLRLNQLRDPCRLTAGLALILPEGEDAPRKTLELSAVAELSAPAMLWEELLPALSWVCPFCRRPTPEGLPGPTEAERRLLALAGEAGAAPLLTLANLDGEGHASAALAHSLLGAAPARQKLLDQVLRALEEGPYRGLHLHFCCLHPFDRENYNAFLRLAAPALHAGGWYLSTALAPKADDGERSLFSSAHDYAVHGQTADRVILLACDWGTATGAPQPVSPLHRIREVLDYAAGKLPLGKLSLALSGQGRSWELPWRLGGRSLTLSNAAAANLAVADGAEIKLDPLSRNSYFLCAGPENRRRMVWFEDARGVAAKLRLAEDYGLAGLCFLGGSRPDRTALAYVRSQSAPREIY